MNNFSYIVLLITLVYFVNSSFETTKYEAYARQLFNIESMVNMTDALGKEYVFETHLKLPNFAVYRYEEPIPISEENPRKYVVTHVRPIEATEGKSTTSWTNRFYTKGTILDIIKIKEMPKEKRIRGQVKDTLNWVSIKNLESSYTWMEPVTPDKIIEFKVITEEDKKLQKCKLEIEFLKLHTINKNSINENLVQFFKLFQNIHKFSPFQTKLKLRDHFQFPPTRTYIDNIVNSNLKFHFFFQFGETFFEQFNFEYVVQIPAQQRKYWTQKLDWHDFWLIGRKYHKINLPHTISELIEQIENIYSEKEGLQFFVDIFFPRFTKTFFDNFPVEMIYRPPGEVAATKEKEKTEKLKQKSSFFSTMFSKSSKSKYKTLEEVDNFL